VPTTPWQQRIRRAKHLAQQHPFAAEVLDFYILIASFQEDLYQRIERASRNRSAGVPSASSGQAPPAAGATNLPESPELLDSFSPFLALVEQNGPAIMAQVARELEGTPASAWSDLLNAVWLSTDEPPSSPQEFLAFAFLQPYAEYARSQSPQQDGYTHPRCPFCGRNPALGILRPQGDGARRSLLCGFCLAEWEFRRVVCPGCGQEDHARLPVYTAETFPYIRVECCDACHTYIKSVDLSKNGLAEPLVDELASVPLDLWAQERGYAKLRPNLLGM
jgi:FdhE protein